MKNLICCNLANLSCKFKLFKDVFLIFSFLIPILFSSSAFAVIIYWSEFGISDEIRRVDTADVVNTNTQIISFTSVNPRGIAIDSVRGKIYWMQSGNDLGVWRANFFGTASENLASAEKIVSLGAVTPRSIAVDAKNGKVYWTESFSLIRRANLDGTVVETIETALTPRGIAVDPSNGGKVYWGFSGGTPAIQRKDKNDLDGDPDNIDTIENVATSHIPDGIALDVADSKIYWTESGSTDVIKRDSFDNVVVNDVTLPLVSGGELTSPRGITLDTTTPGDPVMYWADDGNDTIKSMASSGSMVTPVLSSLDDPFGIAILETNAAIGSSVTVDLLDSYSLIADTVSTAGLVNRLTSSKTASDFTSASSLVGQVISSTITEIKKSTIITPVFAGNLRVTFPFPDGGIPGFSEGELKIFEIDDNGVFIAQGTNTSVDTANNSISANFTVLSSHFAVGVNPEPATLILLGSGLLGLLPFRKRR